MVVQSTQKIVELLRFVDEDNLEGNQHDVLRLLGDAATKIEQLHSALVVIRDLPLAEQDNMNAANMRKIARDALDE